MKRWTWLVVGVLGLTCVGGVFALQSYRAAQVASTRGQLEDVHTVEKGEVLTQVVESGTVDAVRVVELKSRAAGRLAQLLVEEGDKVGSGSLIAVIDPTETRLQVEQNSAQLRGAQSSVERQSIEIAQRRILAKANVDKARLRLRQLERELVSQPTLTRSAIESARSAVENATKQRELWVQATHPNERTAAASEREQAQCNFDNATRELKRLEDLLRQEFVSLREVENQRLQVDLARSRRDAANLRLSRLPGQHTNELRQADERIRQARADLNRAQANGVQDFSKQQEVAQARIAVKEAEAQLTDVQALEAGKAQGQASVDQIRVGLRDSQRQLGETEIRAPYAGVITKKLVQEGELVSSLSSFSSGTAIVRLEDRSSMMVKLNINEIDVAKLQLGMNASVIVDALPTEQFTGQISKIAPARNQPAQGSDSVVRYEVEVRLTDPIDTIKSGMTAKCTMNVVDRKGVLRIPTDYLIREGTDRFVMVLPEKPTKEAEGTKTKIEVGAESAGFVEILSGVSVGTKLKRPEFSGPPRSGARIRMGG